MKRTPQSVWDNFSQMPEQDMAEYLPYLREIARGNVLEIGVCAGVSTAAFLLGMDEKNDGHLWSIDINPECNLFDHPRWTFIHGDSRYVSPIGELDALLIDGCHCYSCASSDLSKFSLMVKPGGFILMHDVEPSQQYLDKCRRWFPVDETRKAWDEFVSMRPTWHHRIAPGMTGMGISQVA